MVIEDLMSLTDDRVTKLFIKKIHHFNIVTYLVQTLFPKGKESRTINVNAQYNALDQTNISRSCKVHARSIQRRNVRTTRILFVDLKQTTPEHLRLRTDIIPEPDKVQNA